MSLINELKRRNVFKVAIAYIVMAWLVMQVADVILNNVEAPGWVFHVIMLLLSIGLPFAIFFAWAFELTPEGIKREHEIDRSRSITHITGRKLDYFIIAVLVLALGYFAFDKFVLDPTRDAELVQATAEAATVSGKAEAADKSIAVLPFVNMSDDPGNEYFSDGIAEELLNVLTRVEGLRVVSRTSSFAFKGKEISIPSIAKELNVNHVLEGSVRKAGNNVRVTAQLIEARSDTHLWSKTFDRTLDNIFAIQDEIASAVVDELKITLLGKELKTTVTTPQVFTLYLQGRHLNNQLTSGSSKQAETLLKQVLEIDPGYAPAWTELGLVYERQAGEFGIRSTVESSEMARNAIQNALAIDSQIGQAYAILARVEMYYDWDFTAAYQHIQQAMALNPGDAAILFSAGSLNKVLGRADNAVDLMQQSIALDPLFSFGHLWLGDMYFRTHRLEEAEDSLQMALTLNPDAYAAHSKLGFVLLEQGDVLAALSEMEQETGKARRLFGLVIVHHAMGDMEASNAALEELIENGEGWAYQIAMAYAVRGEIDNAFDWLDIAYGDHDAGLAQLLSEPQLVNLHGDPRWELLLDKMGLPH